MAVITPKLDDNHVFEQWIFRKNSFKFFFTNALPADNVVSFVDEFESLVITNLEATNDTKRTKLLAKINFLVNFIAYIISTPLDKKNLITFL